MGSSTTTGKTVTLSESATGMPGTYKKLTGGSSTTASAATEAIGSSVIDKNISNTIVSAGVTIGTPFFTGTEATATFTLSDKPNEGSTITLTDAASLAVVFEIDNEANGASGSNVAVDGIAAAGGGATGTAADLVAKINASSLAMTAANPSTGKVDLTMTAKGTSGHKAIATNDSSHWDSVSSVNVPAAFTNGVDPSPGSVKIEGSYDGTNFYDLGITVVADTEITATGTKMGIADLTNVYVPRTRLVFNAENGVIDDPGSAGTLNFIIATPS